MVVGVVETIERLAMPAIIALLGGGGLFQWLQSRSPHRRLAETFEAERESLKRQLATERERVDRIQSENDAKLAELSASVADLQAKITNMQDELKGAWAWAGKLEGELHARDIPLPDG